MGCGDGKGCGVGGTDYVCVSYRKEWDMLKSSIHRNGVTPPRHQLSQTTENAISHLKNCSNSVCRIYYAPEVEHFFPPEPSTT